MSKLIKFSDGGSVDAEMANMSKRKSYPRCRSQFKRKEKGEDEHVGAIAGMPPPHSKEDSYSGYTDCEENQ